jgi:tetratricopeptide (TPR) repeat protein
MHTHDHPQKAEGDACFKNGMFDHAVSRYTEALKQLSRAAGDVHQERATWLNNRAAASMQIRDYDSVIRDCSEVLQLQSANVKALVRRGLAYEQTEKLELAAKVCTCVYE